MRTLLVLIALVALALPACIPGPSLQPATDADRLEIMTTLQDRSFRRFEPSVDADRRKGIILDFFGPVTLWAQYAVGNYAVEEWEIVAHDYRIERSDDFSIVTIHLEGASTRRILSDECEDCLPTAGVSISVRDLFDGDRIRFRINDPNGVLPSPFPVFQSWTRLPEDELFDSG